MDRIAANDRRGNLGFGRIPGGVQGVAPRSETRLEVMFCHSVPLLNVVKLGRLAVFGHVAINQPNQIFAGGHARLMPCCTECVIP